MSETPRPNWQTKSDVYQELLIDPDKATAAMWSLHRLGQTDSIGLDTLRRGLKNAAPSSTP